MAYEPENTGVIFFEISTFLFFPVRVFLIPYLHYFILFFSILSQ